MEFQDNGNIRDDRSARFTVCHQMKKKLTVCILLISKNKGIVTFKLNLSKAFGVEPYEMRLVAVPVVSDCLTGK